MNTMRKQMLSHKILSDYYILKNISEYLSVKDQLTLLDVCESFRYVIVELIWKVKFRHLHIYETPYVSIVVERAHITAYDALAGQNKDDAMGLRRISKEKIDLKTPQCKKFFLANSRNVQFLKICSEYCDFVARFSTLDVFQAHICENLLHLCYHKMVVSNIHLALLGKHCRKLKRIEFLECVCADLKPLLPGDNLYIEGLAQIIHLEALVIQTEIANEGGNYEMESQFLLELLKTLNLKCLQLENLKIIGEAGKKKNWCKVLHLDDLKILDIGCISEQFWPTFKKILQRATNLEELLIKVANCNTVIDLEMMEILKGSSLNLKRLAIENCDLQIKNFCVLEKLEEISLSNCGGFTFENLQEIMGGLPQLRRFNLINTWVLGEINHIYVSPSLQYITIDTIRFPIVSEAFQKSLNKFENLHQLRWLNGDINDNWIIEKCPNLKVLHIPNAYLLRRVAFTAKLLQEFTFTSCEGLSWRVIWILIKNLKLRRLSLLTHDLINDPSGFPESGKNTKTTLRLITIPYGIFMGDQEFWLDLMDYNQHLKIIVYGSHVDLMQVKFIHNLLTHNHMPKRLKNIRICGFSIDFQDLRLNFMKIMQQLNLIVSHYRSRNVPFTMEI
ncbi:uncharacterized protein isoform X1 [Musca autumnalis]|uniref:uncharacterized protein isoform X1 n=1 Tax=Musca autumnalis TaxID=221902 RepID=UPI003CE73637